MIIEFPELEDVVSPKQGLTVPPKKFLMTSFSPETEDEPPLRVPVQVSSHPRVRPSTFVSAVASTTLRVEQPKKEPMPRVEEDSSSSNASNYTDQGNIPVPGRRQRGQAARGSESSRTFSSSEED